MVTDGGLLIRPFSFLVILKIVEIDRQVVV